MRVNDASALDDGRLGECRSGYRCVQMVARSAFAFV